MVFLQFALPDFECESSLWQYLLELISSYISFCCFERFSFKNRIDVQGGP